MMVFCRKTGRALRYLDKYKEIGMVWVDFLRVVATFSVVWLHSAAPLLHKYNELPITDWWVANIYDSMVRVCVPSFFMLSGYLLLNKSEDITCFFTKRIGKVVLPLIIWSLLYILWKHYYQGSEFITLYSFYSLVLTPACFHLWFLYALVGLYLFVPILRVLVQYSSKMLLYYFVVLWFFAVSIIPFFEKVVNIESEIDLKMISGYVGYLVVGHILGNIKVTKKTFIISVFIFIVLIAVTAVGTYLLTDRKEGVFMGYFYSYLSPNVIFMSLTFFIGIKYIAETVKVFQSEVFKKIIKTLSSASLGIYFIHIMVFDILNNGDLGFQLSPFSLGALYSVPVTAIVTFSLSFLVIYLIQRIPIIQKIVP